MSRHGRGGRDVPEDSGVLLPEYDDGEAVLNAEMHDYLFFAAKADFSGTHNFSRTLSEHNHYAALYQKELDKRKIFK